MALGHLGGHVVDRPLDLALLDQLFQESSGSERALQCLLLLPPSPVRTGHPPVEDQRLAEAAQHDVPRLQVAMQDAPAVGVRDRIADGQEVSEESEQPHAAFAPVDGLIVVPGVGAIHERHNHANDVVLLLREEAVGLQFAEARLQPRELMDLVTKSALVDVHDPLARAAEDPEVMHSLNVSDDGEHLARRRDVAHVAHG